MKHVKLVFFVFFIFGFTVNAQDYTSFFTGDLEDVETNKTQGYCLMGGATENDDAMRWFLNLADGGDVLVLRASGGDGYNNYFYEDLEVSINSVETIVLHNSNVGSNAYILQQIQNAEAIWFAGGDQWDYVSYLKNTPLHDALNEHILIKNAPIGGTSAGMAILGAYYFDAQYGTITSDQALANPFREELSLGYNDFLQIPTLSQVITDTHFDDPDRRGRLISFLARVQDFEGTNEVMGIACDEFTSVGIDENGQAIVFGGYPAYDDFAYFVKINCIPNNVPSQFTPEQSLNWNNDAGAIKAFRVGGTSEGNSAMNINTNEFFDEHGQWFDWNVNEANFTSTLGTDYECDLNTLENRKATLVIYPNPTQKELYLNSTTNSIKGVDVFNTLGKNQASFRFSPLESARISLESFSEGVYILQVHFENGKTQLVKLLKN